MKPGNSIPTTMEMIDQIREYREIPWPNVVVDLGGARLFHEARMPFARDGGGDPLRLLVARNRNIRLNHEPIEQTGTPSKGNAGPV